MTRGNHTYWINVSLLISLPLFCPWTNESIAAEPTVVFLVRHAEKVDSSRDPELSTAGMDRAKRLANVLRSVKLDRIHSSDYMRTRRVPIPVGRLGPTDMYVQAMSYFRPATSAPMVAQVQKMLAERITKAVAEREERVVRAWRYFTMMYTTYRKWRAIAHSPCTITTLVALQQLKMDCCNVMVSLK